MTDPAQVGLWLARKLADVAPGIRRDVEHWLRTMVNGGPRTKPRSLATAQNYLNAVQPISLTGRVATTTCGKSPATAS